MLSKGDDYPLHQTAEPVAYAGTDRNFYDRYFFNGYAPAARDARMFGVAFGVYPHLDIADAHFSWLQDGRQISLHASCWLGMERLAMQVGPIAIEVIEPLRQLRVTIDAPEHHVRAELRFDGRAAPIEEPRFTRRLGPRTLLDYTRLTQNGDYRGWVEIDGARATIDGWLGTRDRSWGVRPIGARDPQEAANPAPPQFFWLWSPCAFADGDLFFHTNDDAGGRPWNRRAVWAPIGAAIGDQRHFAEAAATIGWRSGTRAAARAQVALDGGAVRFAPVADFMMTGIGYGHPRWAHGLNHGALVVEREEWTVADLDRRLPHHFHIQALSDVAWTDADGRERLGRGVLEQLAIGAHAPSGFAGLMDVAP